MPHGRQRIFGGKRPSKGRGRPGGSVFPSGVYRYSDPVPTPAGLDASSLFAK
jgi:hypothetical protein